ncbi:MAG: hypothetical protein NC203_07895 [Firmicutes bacterium]|nr:hypothetical protein [Bacillota bacterium]
MLAIKDFDRQYSLPQKLSSASRSDFKDWVNGLFSPIEIQRPRVVSSENVCQHSSGGSKDDENQALADLAAQTAFNSKLADASAELEELVRGGMLESYSA